ncbi:lipase secretion chaperone [Stutzerimonas sp. VN223-3]|uniref:lipase secretion chaperone n=1 Tax=Stutzerimonas sp. VN223-3 TaxID=3384601 RepID=UPI0038B67803
MKKLALLFLLVVTIGVAAIWHEPTEPTLTQAKALAEPAIASSPALQNAKIRSLDPQQRPSTTINRLPGSFAGTQVDGRLQADPSGNLIVDGNVRRVFDYFLAAIGEESVEASVTRLRRYIEEQLPQPAEGQALQVLGQYLDYKRQLLMLEKTYAQRADIDAMRERLRAVQQLRAGIFSESVHQAFFALDEATDRFTLERLAIRRDPTLDAAAKGAAIDRLQNSLPAELLDSLAPQLQTELHEQTRTLQANGATPSEIRQLRQQLVGNVATARLEKLDRKRQDWQRRVKAYREEKVRIENSRGLGETDKRAAIDRMAAERFDEHERLRLEAAEQLLAAKNS